jgi:hypothetical protein
LAEAYVNKGSNGTSDIITGSQASGAVQYTPHETTENQSVAKAIEKQLDEVAMQLASQRAQLARIEDCITSPRPIALEAGKKQPIVGGAWQSGDFAQHAHASGRALSLGNSNQHMTNVQNSACCSVQ